MLLQSMTPPCLYMHCEAASACPTITDQIPRDSSLTALVMAVWVHSKIASADSTGALGDVLLLRHVVMLLALDLRLRIRAFQLRGPDCEARLKLLFSSILWSLYAV